MGLTELTTPMEYPVSLDDAKGALKLQTSDEDPYVQNLINAATKRVENWTGRPLIERDFRLTLDQFPASGQAIHLPKRPVTSIDRVALVEQDNIEIEIASSTYSFDLSPGSERLYPVEGSKWPVPRRSLAGIFIDFRAGYGASPTDIPADIRELMFNLIAHGFESREGADPARENALRKKMSSQLLPYTDLRL